MDGEINGGKDARISKQRSEEKREEGKVRDKMGQRKRGMEEERER